MLSMPDYCRWNAHQNDNKKSNPTGQNGNSHMPTEDRCGGEQRGTGKPPTVGARITGNSR